MDSYIAELVEIVVATVLLFKRYRSQPTVNMLKIVFAFSIEFSVLSGAIDVAHWKDAFCANFVRLVWPSWREHYYIAKRKDI